MGPEGTPPPLEQGAVAMLSRHNRRTKSKLKGVFAPNDLQMQKDVSYGVVHKPLRGDDLQQVAGAREGC
jgi:hypothetical protein